MGLSTLGQGLMRLAGMFGNVAGKYGPAASKVIGKVGIPAAVGTAVGGIKGAQEAGPGGVIPGALGGGLTGGGLGMIPGVGGLNPYLQGGLGTLGGLYGPSSMGVVGGGAQNLGGIAAMNIQNQPNAPATMVGGSSLPPIGGAHSNMFMGPDGNIYQELNPMGYRQGSRFGSGLDTMQNISNYNRWGDAQFAQSERKQKADFERDLAAAQLKRNMDLAQAISNRTHAGTVNIAQQAGQDMGTMLNTKNTFF